MYRRFAHVAAPLSMGLLLLACAKLPPDTAQVMQRAEAARAVIAKVHGAACTGSELPAVAPCEPGPHKALLLSRSELEAGFERLDLDRLFKDGRRLEVMPVEGATIFPPALDPLLHTERLERGKAKGWSVKLQSRVVEETRKALDALAAVDHLAVYRVVDTSGGVATEEGTGFHKGSVRASVVLFDPRTGAATCSLQVTASSSESVRATRERVSVAVEADLRRNLRRAVLDALAGK